MSPDAQETAVERRKRHTMESLRLLEEWHLRIVSEHPGETLTTIPVRENGSVVRHIPAYLPAWMRCEAREAFLEKVETLKARWADQPDHLDMLHNTPGVPMRAAVQKAS